MQVAENMSQFSAASNVYLTKKSFVYFFAPP